MYDITVTADFFADQQKSTKPVPEENLTGHVCAAWIDSTGRTWYAFELPDVFGCWCIEHGSRFMVSIERPAKR